MPRTRRVAGDDTGDATPDERPAPARDTSGPVPLPATATAPVDGAARIARPPRVAAVIPAKDEARRITATVRAVRAIPGVDLVLVVDDGSEDETQHVAREAGAVVVRHSHNRGRAAAMETGAAVVAMRDAPDRAPRALLFLAGDLGESAVAVAPLVTPVLDGDADMTVALLSPGSSPGGHGWVIAAARRAIAQLTGWTPAAPLSRLRCLTRAAYEAATPLARGDGVEPAMTIDLIRGGYRVVEVPVELRHHPAGNSLRVQARRAAGYRDVELALSARRARAAAETARDRLDPRKGGGAGKAPTRGAGRGAGDSTGTGAARGTGG